MEFTEFIEFLELMGFIGLEVRGSKSVVRDALFEVRSPWSIVRSAG
jgi:hypothetical protein